MPTLRLGPLRLSQRLEQAREVRRGPLQVVPVALVRELVWLGRRQGLVLRRARPDHIQILTFAGARHIAVERRAGLAPALALVGLVAPLLTCRLAARGARKE